MNRIRFGKKISALLFTDTASTVNFSHEMTNISGAVHTSYDLYLGKQSSQAPVLKVPFFPDLSFVAISSCTIFILLPAFTIFGT